MATLQESLERLRQLDEQDDIDIVAQVEAMENVKAKIDSYRYVIEQLTMQQEYYERKQAEAHAMAIRYKRMAERCEQRVLFNMQQDGSRELYGHESMACIQKSERAKLVREKPTQEDIVKHSDYISFSWKWNLSKIKSDLKAGIGNAQEVASLITCDNLKWRHNGNAGKQ
jgi:hypothetical protein